MPDKVFGPLTIRQFVLLAIGLAPILLIYKFFQTWVLLFFGIPLFAFTLAMVFYKHNGVALPTVVMNFIRFAFAHKLYIWKKREVEGSTLPSLENLPQLSAGPTNNPAMTHVMQIDQGPAVSSQHRSLSDLALIMTTRSGKKEDDDEPIITH
jgi:hypothetical protein